MTGNVLGLQYPRSKTESDITPHTIVLGPPTPYLHCYQSVVDENFLCEEISSDSGFVASTELLIDLFISKNCKLAIGGIRDRPRYGRRELLGGEVERTYWFIRLVFPTPLSPRMIT
jgi:hypothetical protein